MGLEAVKRSVSRRKGVLFESDCLLIDGNYTFELKRSLLSRDDHHDREEEDEEEDGKWTEKSAISLSQRD